MDNFDGDYEDLIPLITVDHSHQVIERLDF